MRWLINYIRSCFCKHDWDIARYPCYDSSLIISDKRPVALRFSMLCKRCGYCKRGNLV
jgi:hypothetical protein